QRGILEQHALDLLHVAVVGHHEVRRCEPGDRSAAAGRRHVQLDALDAEAKRGRLQERHEREREQKCLHGSVTWACSHEISSLSSPIEKYHHGSSTPPRVALYSANRCCASSVRPVSRAARINARCAVWAALLIEWAIRYSSYAASFFPCCSA